MPLNGEPPDPAGAPVALATISVDGRCRERSPVDLALFGPKGERLIERFVEAGEGQVLFARATADGAAEGVAMLRTLANDAPFRVSLWRQRGGDKIRVLAAFSEIAPAPDPAPPEAHHITNVPDPMALTLDAVRALAERLHLAEGAPNTRDTGDLLAAAWRLKALATGPRVTEAPREVDLARLARRAVRLAAAGQARDDTTVRFAEIGIVPLIIGEEAALWTMLDHLILAALKAVAAPASLTLNLDFPGERAGLVLSVTAEGSAPAGRLQKSEQIDAARVVAARHDAVLEADSMTSTGFEARVVFPLHRCLAAP